ncbi:hypothetical protein ABZY05_39965 [Streptomyces canus]
MWRYRYDPLGRRIAKQHLAADGASVLEQGGLRLGRHDSLRTDHHVAAAEAPQEGKDSRFFAVVTDLVGSSTELVDEQGEIAWRTRSTLDKITKFNELTLKRTWIPLLEARVTNRFRITMSSML